MGLTGYPKSTADFRVIPRWITFMWNAKFPALFRLFTDQSGKEQNDHSRATAKKKFNR
jgi:hypothetical protein